MKRGKLLFFILPFLCLSLVSTQNCAYAALITNKHTFINSFKNLCLMHSEHAYYRSIGKTVEGADIYAFYIGHGETKVVVQGELHGHEFYTSNALYFLAKWILETNSTETRSILKRLTVILIPTVNFDRWAVSRKNAHGVDLNRNFKWLWGTSGSSDPNSDQYRGPYALSEPESYALHQFYVKVKPKVFLDLHDFGATQPQGDIRWERNRNEQEHQNFYNKYVEIATSKNVTYWAYVLHSSNVGGYAYDDAREYGGAVSFLGELNNSTPTESQVQGEIKDRLACFLIAADQLYGKEAAINESWIKLAEAILVVALIAVCFKAFMSSAD